MAPALVGPWFVRPRVAGVAALGMACACAGGEPRRGAQASGQGAASHESAALPAVRLAPPASATGPVRQGQRSASPRGSASVREGAAADRTGEPASGAAGEPKAVAASAWLGVELAAAPRGEAGVLVRDVIPRSPAATVGIRPGDRLLTVQGAALRGVSQASEAIGARGAGQEVALGLLRGETRRLFRVRLTPRPARDELLRLRLVGRKAPDLDALVVFQGPVEPSWPALRGRVVVLDFWAPWCPPCRLLVPVLKRWRDRFGALGFEVLSITAEPLEPATTTAFQWGMDNTVAVDRGGRTTQAFGADALPTLVVVDRQGRVRDVLMGFSSSALDDLESEIATLLEETESTSR